MQSRAVVLLVTSLTHGVGLAPGLSPVDRVEAPHKERVLQWLRDLLPWPRLHAAFLGGQVAPKGRVGALDCGLSPRVPGA